MFSKELTEKDRKLVEEIVNQMKDYFKSEEFEIIVGNIVFKGMKQSLRREIRFEDSKTETGRVVEKTETWDILDWLVRYFPYMEGALRGVQSDADQARNRASEVKQLLAIQLSTFHEIIEKLEAAKETESGAKEITLNQRKLIGD